jgi:C1A family cysteine protease
MPTIQTISGMKGLGWVPGNRVHFKSLPLYKSASGMFKLAPSVDLRSLDTPIKDQGNLGSCTSFMATGVMQFVRKGLGLPDMSLSELFIYYGERVLENTVSYDSGASIGDAFAVLASPGACQETDWPYDISKFTQKPPAQAYTDAALDVAAQELALDGSLDSIKQCLAEGSPVGFGFDVYSSFRNIGADGIMPVPGPDEELLGGHAVMFVGYNDTTQRLIVRNSWGTGWGASGYFEMPYEIVTNGMAQDFRTVKAVSGTPAPQPEPVPVPTPTPTPTPTPAPATAVDQEVRDYLSAVNAAFYGMPIPPWAS